MSGTSRISGALLQCSLFYGRPVRALVASSSVHRYGAGQSIFRVGEPAAYLVVLVGGRARSDTLRANGAERVLAEHRAPDAIVEVGIFTTDRTRRVGATALTDVEAVHVPRESLLRAAADDAVLAERLLTVIADAAGSPLTAPSPDVEVRLLACLRQLADQFGVPQPDGSMLIGLRVTHAELGTLIGAPGSAVGRAIRVLVDGDELERLGDYYLVPGGNRTRAPV